jgi:hypothetical protein
MSESSRRLNALEERLSRVSEGLQRTSDDVMALQLVLYATIRSHPDPQALIAAVAMERERFLAAALGKTVSEKLIERVEALAQQAIGLAEMRLGRD